MDKNDPIFSHQLEAVGSLSREFERISVITFKVGSDLGLPSNVTVYYSRWVEGESFGNSLRFFRAVIRVFTQGRPHVIFSHMTEVQSALLAPLTKFTRVPHFLWYAHASKSLYLRICEIFCDGIISSTVGSCPISGRKINLIGQAIDSQLFYFTRRDRQLKKFVHIGRFDPSKKIDEIIETLFSSESGNSKITFTQVGDPSAERFLDYKEDTERRFTNLIDAKVVCFNSSIPRSQLPALLESQDVFIHSFEGSLDKTLIEATMSGLPVVTVNSEYRRIFGGWSNKKAVSLKDELDAFLVRSKDSKSLQDETHRRRLLSEKMHSQRNWIENLTQILKNG
jgi:glycosyltransferase involved in cell wall biosynthesis